MTAKFPNADAPVTAIFHDRASARRAIVDLKIAGFDERHLGLISRQGDDENFDVELDTKAAGGAAAGVAAGAGLGALWAIGIAAGFLPLVGPAIAGGLLASVLASAAGGAVVGGLIGALVGLGIPEDEARFLETELHAGRTLITVQSDDRKSEVQEILARHGGKLRIIPAEPEVDLTRMEESAAMTSLEAAGFVDDRPATAHPPRTPTSTPHATADLPHAELDSHLPRT